MEKADFIEVGMSAVDPEKQFGIFQARYEDGARDTAFLRKYTAVLASAGLPSADVAEEYLTQLDEKQLLSRSAWLVIANNFHDVPSQWVSFVDRHEKEFTAIAGAADYVSWMDYIAEASQGAYYREHGTEGVEAWKELLRKYLSVHAEKYEIAADYAFRIDLPFEESHPYAKAWFDARCEAFPQLNAVAWTYFEKVEDKNMLEDALWWSRRSVEMYEGGFNTDTEANLLAKLGRWKEAAIMAQHSIELSEKEGNAAEETKALLKEIQSHL
jgi:hypothetical protein